ncbi:hypothetical protein CFC21_102045, partial [Triticum aestivum]
IASSKSSLAMFALAIVMAVVAGVSAQNTLQDFVNLHNRARAADGVGPVTWTTAWPGSRRTTRTSAPPTAGCSTRRAVRREHLLGFRAVVDGLERREVVGGREAELPPQHQHLQRRQGVRAHAGGVAQVDPHRLRARGQRREPGRLHTCNYNPPGNFNGERPFAFLTLDAEAKW